MFILSLSGMMDSAYFVGRRELLEFFNELLKLQLAKIEQTASGAVACQLMEYIYPKSIPMSRVNWEAKCVKKISGLCLFLLVLKSSLIHLLPLSS
jgi:hypothetical protein